MADETDPLVQAMIGAGLYPQQLQQLQRQYGLGQQLMETPSAQGRQVGQTYVASSPLEHLSNALRQFMGARMSKGALSNEQNLTGQLGTNRQAMMSALNRASGQQAPGTPEMLARAADPQEMQRLALMGAASGDPAMENVTKAAMQMQHNQTELARLGNTQQYQRDMVDLRNREQKTQFDPLGNQVTTPTHAPKPGSALPLSTGGGGSRQPKTPWSQDALDKDAEMLAVSGDYKRMPGKIGAAYDLAVRKRSTELYPEASRALDKGQYASNVNSLRKLQVAQDSLESFEKGMLQNGRLMLDTAKGLVDTGSPFFNRPVRAWKFAAGDPNAARFNAARQVFVQEAGKVLGGAVQGGGLTEGQRHEAEAMMRGDMTLPQMEATLQTLEADAANRKQGAAQQIQAILERMNPKKGGGQGGAAPAEVAKPVRRFTRGPDGKLVEVQGP